MDYPRASNIGTQTWAEGQGGNILLTVENLQILDAGTISANVFGPGQGGDIEVNAKNITISGVLFQTGTGLDYHSRIDARVVGDTAIGADSITMTGFGNGSAERIDFTGLRSDTLDGMGGNISIDANTFSASRGARVMSDSSGSGRGGNVGVNAGLLQLSEDAEISAKSTSAGYAGNVNLTLGTLNIDSGFISTEAQQTDGGDITVAASYMAYLLNSEITTSVNGGPETTGGNILIDPRYVVLNDSRIIANAYEGHGGSVRIVSDVFLASPDSTVSASSQLGIDGTVDIQSPVTDISGTLAPVRGSFLQSADMVRDRCMARLQGTPRSSLTVSGRDGLPPRPGTALPASLF